MGRFRLSYRLLVAYLFVGVYGHLCYGRTRFNGKNLSKIRVVAKRHRLPVVRALFRLPLVPLFLYPAKVFTNVATQRMADSFIKKVGSNGESICRRLHLSLKKKGRNFDALLMLEVANSYRLYKKHY